MKRIASGFGLLDGARWYPDWGLVFSDMTNGGVFRLRSAASVPEVLIPHRKGIGGVVLHAGGGFVVSGRNVAHKAVDGTTTVLLETKEDEQFFNDMSADGRGRLYVGSVAFNPLASQSPTGAHSTLGRLYRIDLDGSVIVLAEDVMTSNGIGSDPSDSLLYHVDTGRKRVWRFRIAATADGRDREEYVDTSEYAGGPDGLSVAEDGSVWVAMAGGGVVVGWDPGGRRIAEIALPQTLATDVCFGDEDLGTLYILTGQGEEDGGDETGSVYMQAAPVIGMPNPVAQVRLPK